MDLDRMTPADRVALCRRYFFIGIFGLPWLWFVNAVWFGHFAFIRKGEPKKKNGRGILSGPPGLGGGPAGPGRSTSGEASQSRRNPDGGESSVHRRNPSQQQQSESQQAQQDPEQRDQEAERSLVAIRKYVILSAIGASIWIILIVTWAVIFQLNRVEWGELGDSISFNIPRGIP